MGQVYLHGLAASDVLVLLGLELLEQFEFFLTVLVFVPVHAHARLHGTVRWSAYVCASKFSCNYAELELLLFVLLSACSKSSLMNFGLFHWLARSSNVGRDEISGLQQREIRFARHAGMCCGIFGRSPWRKKIYIRLVKFNGKSLL